ncbi:phytanoyl-CoA dioxygenase family protein [Streptomyces sp. NBC_01343]|uniref:phytanoyl-CoA dioxygenase family protein n=1 Tax=Streptomyces sp. NBC_01343 TaxID=2903832 RepID=UPI002E15F981|nr:phytanoyl-CoA dioxygenase family protein [Streptomyces sp. NBC_01343]
MTDPKRLLAAYRRDGFVVVPPITPHEIWAPLTGELPSVLAEEGPQRFFEEDGTTVRAVYGLHRRGGPWQALAEASPLTALARLLLGEDMYVYQWKVNPKAARHGDRWQWHRDFDFWRAADGMRRPAALTAAVFLDEVTEENGPLRLIPGTHADLPATAAPSGNDGLGESGESGESGSEAGDWAWITSNRNAYALPDPSAEELARTRAVHEATGPAGTAVLFHGNLVHSSGPNRSSRARTLALISYNAVSNAPPAGHPAARQDLFVNHDAKPLPLGDDGYRRVSP